MFNKLNQALSRPKLYKQTQEDFWNEPHISAQMLKAHLDPHNDGASRSHDFIERSASWIANTLSPLYYPRLLDIGCGPGLYAEKFAQAGFAVAGVDFSRRSIEYALAAARKKDLAIDYYYQNYLQLDLPSEVDLATMIYCDYGALPTESRRLVLCNIREHLRPGGILLLDVFSMAAYERFSESQSWTQHPEGGFWRDGAYVELQGCYKYTPNVTLEQFVIVSAAQMQTYYIWNTYFDKQSLANELKVAGFEVCQVLGDVAGARYSGVSKTIAIIARRM